MKEILKFGKHKGKTITDLLNEGEYGYIVWLKENTHFPIDDNIYFNCKIDEVYREKIMHETIMESKHGDWGDRD